MGFDLRPVDVYIMLGKWLFTHGTSWLPRCSTVIIIGLLERFKRNCIVHVAW